jgi:hypothetical protein
MFEPYFIFLGIIGVFVIGFRLVKALYKHLTADSQTPAIVPRDRKAIRVDESRSYAFLSTNGREVFFPLPPHPNTVYEICVEGLLHGDGDNLSDLLYETDASGNFTHEAKWLFINGTSLSRSGREPVVSDRFEHRYVFRLDHPCERRLTLALQPSTRWSGHFKATVTVLPVGTVGVVASRERASARRLASLEEATISSQFGEQIAELCIRSQAFRNWADPAYRKKFAEVHADDLIRNQSDIRNEATTFLSQDKIVRYLRRHHPEVVERYLGRLESLLLAERFAIDKKLLDPPPQPAPPKRKLTAEQVRALKVHKQQVAIGDRVALLFDKVDARLKIRERLDAMDLDPDEREMLERELIAEIEEGDDEHANARTI